MMIRNKIIPLCLLICFQWIADAQTSAPVQRLLQTPDMRGASFSLIVKDVKTGHTLYNYDPERLQSPASVLKTVATATALEILGENYRYPTTIEYDGAVENGILKGNLYIKGSGDPTLGSSHFAHKQHQFLENWITALQQAGIRQITGSVISDESIFDTEGTSPKWLREDMGNYYAPGCYGLSIFDNLYRLSLQTGTSGTRPILKGTQPELSFIHFKNYLKSAPVSSDSAFIIGAPFDNVRYLYGVLPANRKEYILKGDIPDPALFLAQYLTRVLRQKGIQVDGTPSCHRIEAEEGRWKPSERKELITTYSPTLKEIVKVCNHVSHNLYADALLKTVGLRYKPHKYEEISSFGRGVQVVKEYWAKKGMDVFALRMNDGSGLAPTNKVSAGFMGELLVYMATKSTASNAFITSLPQTGIEGSVRNFLKESKLQGKARLKSGGITGVRNYAGYITKDGKTYAIAVFSNNYACPMRRMTTALERLLLQLFEE